MIIETEEQLHDREQARIRHDIDSGIFQGRYIKYDLGKYTDEFIYGRYQIFEEVKADLNMLPAGSRVLDLGCGTGHLSKFISDKGYEVTGLDPSEGMLGFARENFPDIIFIEGVSVKLPFEDASFDYVVSIEVLRYLNQRDVEQTYAEIYRILKPGGFFHITHVNRYSTDLYYLYYNLLKITKTKYHNCYFTTANNEKKLAMKCGFSRVEVVGRMFASIRIAFKFGKFIGRSYTKLLDLFNSKQSFKGIYKDFTGHLIVRGYKG